MGQQELVLVLTSNLFFLPRIESAAEHFGLEVASVASATALLEAAGTRTVSLVLVDLEVDEPVWSEAITAVNESVRKDGTPLVVAYGPHGEPEVLRKARELGSDAVIIKRDFSERLPELLESRGRAFVR
jgi:CheY-like chemotaxis protein